MTLHLSLYGEFFEAVLAGEKRIEYRRRCPRWDRMLSKPHSQVKFVNGYGALRPWLICKISRIEEEPGEWRIHLGAVLSSGNLELLKTSSKSRPSR
jgi:hypothetical protein